MSVGESSPEKAGVGGSDPAASRFVADMPSGGYGLFRSDLAPALPGWPTLWESMLCRMDRRGKAD
jgi:hypothetical protein